MRLFEFSGYIIHGIFRKINIPNLPIWARILPNQTGKFTAQTGRIIKTEGYFYYLA
jgi:hypothetical protein